MMDISHAVDAALSKRALRVLVVEDTPADAELLIGVLKQAGYSLTFDAVDSPPLLGERLSQTDYDLVLSGHNLREGTGLDALQVLRESGKNVPFVVVTGSLGDEAAVEYIKQGASEYVLKHRLQSLPATVGQVLQEKAHREEAARLQEVILSAKEDWELTFDTVPDSVLLLDVECRVRRANRATARLLGRELSEIIGRPCYEVLHGQVEPRPDCPHQRLLATGEAQRGDIEEPYLGRSFEMTTTPLLDSHGLYRGCVHVMHDITERRRAEEALRESNENLHSLIHASPLPIVALDSEERVVMWSRAAERLFGWAEHEVVGRPNPLFMANHQRYSAALECLVQGQELTNVESFPQKRDGSQIQANLSGAPVRDAKGRIRGLMVVFDDVTERKRVEEQLRQAQKMEAVGQLAGGVAHDFNNLLNVILGYSGLILERLKPDDPLVEKVEEIKKAGERATTLTRQLLAFSRKQVLEPSVLDLNAVISDMEKMLRRVIEEHIEVVTVPDPTLGPVRADRGQIEQVLMNLAVNARDAMPRGGRLTIETANVDLDSAYARRHVSVPPGPYVILAVSDTGHGMDPETKARIFEPFFTTKERNKGTGLGLSMVYGIVKQSGGYIWVYSEPGKGSTFKVYLPRLESATKASDPAPPAARAARALETILLVEDEESLRKLAREYLEAQGYLVIEAGHGEEALQVSAEYLGPIHLMVTDVVMPRMSGPELADRLGPARPKMKVLYVSGYTDSVMVHQGVLKPGIAFLQKPFSPNELKRKVREVLERELGDLGPRSSRGSGG